MSFAAGEEMVYAGEVAEEEPVLLLQRVGRIGDELAPFVVGHAPGRDRVGLEEDAVPGPLASPAVAGTRLLVGGRAGGNGTSDLAVMAYKIGDDGTGASVHVPTATSAYVRENISPRTARDIVS